MMNIDTTSILYLALLVTLAALVGRLEQRARRTERQLQALLRHFGVEDPAWPLPSEKVRALLADPNGRIAAIKQYRAETGLGLKDAHDALAATISPLSGESSS